MTTLAQTIRTATRRAGDEEEEDPKATGAAGDTTEESEEDEDQETSAEDEEDDEAAEDEEEGKPTAAAPKAGYDLTAATQTLELCAIAGVGAKVAHRFVSKKTPLAAVRAKLAATQAPAAERLETSRPKNEAGSGWDDVVARVNAALPTAPKR